MRQRVLLVAGWAAAAIVTSVVASGAVTVAGGQVTDRPLRPLSASEVDALPVVLNEGGNVPCRPLASGGSDRDVATPEDGVRGTSDDDGSGPAGDETPPPDESKIRTEVVSVRGGTVSIANSDGRLRIFWATVRPGFTMQDAFADDRSVSVTFSCGEDQSVIIAEPADDGGITIRTFESSS